jgi:hypothetical protein
MQGHITSRNGSHVPLLASTIHQLEDLSEIPMILAV